MTKYFDLIGFSLIGLAFINQLIYAVRLQLQKDRAAKYHFASANEPNATRLSAYLLSASLFFFSFIMIAGFLKAKQPYQFAAAGFMSFLIAFMIGYGFWAYVKYYYPFTLEKRLKKIRFKPMKSPSTGNRLRLLNELEEDQYLTAEMIEKEDNLEADFDVWIDEATKQTIIMQYDITDDAFVCPNCNFRTLKEHREEVLKEATYAEAGLLKREYRCTYCGHREEKEIKIPSGQEKHAAA